MWKTFSAEATLTDAQKHCCRSVFPIDSYFKVVCCGERGKTSRNLFFPCLAKDQLSTRTGLFSLCASFTYCKTETEEQTAHQQNLNSHFPHVLLIWCTPPPLLLLVCSCPGWSPAVPLLQRLLPARPPCPHWRNCCQVDSLPRDPGVWSSPAHPQAAALVTILRSAWYQQQSLGCIWPKEFPHQRDFMKFWYFCIHRGDLMLVWTCDIGTVRNYVSPKVRCQKKITGLFGNFSHIGGGSSQFPKLL